MGGSKQTQTNKTEPWAEAKPYFGDLYAKAATALGQTPTSFNGELYAAPTQAQLDSVDILKRAAANPNVQGADQQTLINAARAGQLAQETLSGKFLDPSSNPYIAAAVEAARRPIEQQLTRSILPGIQDQSIAQGAYGGSGYGTAQGLAISDFTQQALDAANKVYYQNYAQERQNQIQAAQLAAQAASLQQMGVSQMTQPANLLATAGGMEQGWQQGALDAALKKFGVDQAAPWTGVQNMADILTAGGYNTQTQTTKTNPGAAGLLQGALGLAGMLSGLGPLAGLGGGLAGLFGGGLGAGAMGTAAFDAGIWGGASGAAPGVFSFL